MTAVMTAPQSTLTHIRGLLLLSLPIIGGHLAQMLLHVTDTVMMGWYGVTELAALVLAASAFFFLFILGSGVGIGLMGMLSASLGRGDEVQVRRDTRMGLWLSIAYGILVLPALIWSGPVLLALGQKPELATLAQDYLRIAGFGMVPALIVMVLRSYFAALERASVVLWVTLGAVVMNAGLNWALVFGHWGAPELGVRGSAIATLGAQVLSAVALIGYAVWLPATRRFHLFGRFWRPDWGTMGQVLRLGIPAGMTAIAESGMFIAAALMMGWVGKVELAAHGIALQVGGLAFMLYMGISNAVTVRLGKAFGERDRAAMEGVVKASLLLTLGICGLVITGFLLAPRVIIGTFLDEGQADVAAILDFGTRLLAIAALFQLFDALQVLALGFLRAVQDAKVPMGLAAVSYWGVGLPCSYVLAFPMGMGGIGLWIGLVVGLAAAAVLLMIRFFRGGWLAGDWAVA
jgi:multidrug resistance protein, MATE family